MAALYYIVIIITWAAPPPNWGWWLAYRLPGGPVSHLVARPTLPTPARHQQTSPVGPRRRRRNEVITHHRPPHPPGCVEALSALRNTHANLKCAPDGVVDAHALQALAALLQQHTAPVALSPPRLHPRGLALDPPALDTHQLAAEAQGDAHDSFAGKPPPHGRRRWQCTAISPAMAAHAQPVGHARAHVARAQWLAHAQRLLHGGQLGPPAKHGVDCCQVRGRGQRRRPAASRLPQSLAAR